MAATSIKRTGKSKIELMLVAKGEPTGWTEETIVCVFEEKCGARTVFVATGVAKTAFQACEPTRIYDVEVPGQCVKFVSGFTKWGVRSIQEIRTKFPMQMQLSKAAWPISHQYNCVAWNELNQKVYGVFLDIVGRVGQKPERDLSSSFAKMPVILCNDRQTTTVNFLGSHANLQVNEGDVLVLGGVRLKEYNSERTLQTSFCTCMELHDVAQ